MAQIHWLFRTGDIRAFCGIISPLNTTHREKVTCQNCIKLIKLHEHLPIETESDDKAAAN